MYQSVIFQQGDVEAPLAYDTDLAARYQQVRNALEAGHAFPSYADVCTAYRDWLDKEGVQLQFQNAFVDEPLPPEQQEQMLAFLRQWNGDANTLVRRLEEVLQQLQTLQHDFYALRAIVTSTQ